MFTLKCEELICTSTFQFQSDQEDFGQRKIPRPVLAYLWPYWPFFLRIHTGSLHFPLFLLSSTLAVFLQPLPTFLLLVLLLSFVLIKVNLFEKAQLKKWSFLPYKDYFFPQERPHLMVIPSDSYFMRFAVVICGVNMCTFQVDVTVFSLLIVRGWGLGHSSSLTIYGMMSCDDLLWARP